NVRELQNVIQRYVTLGHLDFTHIRATQTVGAESLQAGFDDDFDNEDIGLSRAIEDFEKQYIKRALDENRWQRNKVCAKLCIPRRTLYGKMKKYGLK
ncbi:MAG: Fis family transcriptional regulator, partial [Deltaproteobacteria bacterium]|nr:Fis family transcriptional regulator [Deltaproteobacteria bacterium]